MGGASAWLAPLSGLEGFQLLEVGEHADEVVITVETTATVVGCRSCGARADSLTTDELRSPKPSTSSATHQLPT